MYYFLLIQITFLIWKYVEQILAKHQLNLLTANFHYSEPLKIFIAHFLLQKVLYYIFFFITTTCPFH